jgi:hypothetical protein
MDKLYIKETQYTPEIILDPKGYISIKGKSYPENSFEFYTPIIQWFENYFLTQTNQKTTVDMQIIYFNSSSSKVFFDLFDMFEEYNAITPIEINWIYDKENENVIEAGEDLKEDFPNLTIRFKPTTEDSYNG